MQQAQGAPETDHAVIFGQGGESARVLGAIDWSANPLGPVAGWPTALKVAVQMMLASHFPKAIVWGPSLVTLHNDGFRQILGDKPVSQGRPFDEIWSEVWPEIGPLIHRAFDGHAVFIEDLALNIDRHGYLEPANFTFCYSPIRDETGRVGGVIDTVIETTGKVMAERALELRNAELAHRIKNTFAIVSVIARQSLRNAADTEAAWVTMSNRLGALSETHGLLSAGAWQDIEMRTVIEAALKPHRTGEGRFHIAGAPVTLREKQALTLSLVVNELATNAAKHGALSADGGRIDIGWQREAGPGGDRVRFTWVESGGPPVVAPARESFGSRLLKLIAPQDFDGAAALDFAPGGLVYTLTGALR